jgi:CIC family chloride channel protein
MASRRFTIFHQQVRRKIDSPAHAGDFFVDVLQAFKVKDILYLIKKVRQIPQHMPFQEFKRYFSETTQHYFPVVDDQERLVGIFSINDVRSVLFAPEIEHLVVMKDIGTSQIIKTAANEDLNTVLNKFTTKNIDSLPVVMEDDPSRLIGMLNRREVISFYNQKVAEMKAARAARA